MPSRRLLVVCALMAPALAWADGDATKAKALFEEGRKLIEAADKLAEPAAKAEHVNAACDKFAASLGFDAQLGTKLNLADCRVRQGKLADAYALLDAAVAEATRTHDREAFTKQQLAAVASKVVRVTVRVADPDLSGTSIKLGTSELVRTKWGVVAIVAPGPIVVDAMPPDRKPIHITRDGAAGEAVVIDVAFETIAGPPPPSVPGRSKLPYFVAG